MQLARRELDAGLAGSSSLGDRVRRAAVAPGWGRLVLFCAAYAGVLALCVPLKTADFELWPSLAPSDADQTLVI